MITPKRWTAARKAELLGEICRAEITERQACILHDFKPAEIRAWMELWLAGGHNALKTTKVQITRRNLQASKPKPY